MLKSWTVLHWSTNCCHDRLIMVREKIYRKLKFPINKVNILNAKEERNSTATATVIADYLSHIVLRNSHEKKKPETNKNLKHKEWTFTRRIIILL